MILTFFVGAFGGHAGAEVGSHPPLYCVASPNLTVEYSSEYHVRGAMVDNEEIKAAGQCYEVGGSIGSKNTGGHGREGWVAL